VHLQASPPVLEGCEYRPSLAVMPFRTPQDDQANAYFAAGMVDEIIHALSGLRQLLVIARSSTFGYAGMQSDLFRIGTELGVRYVLHGSVRRTGERLRVSTELTETGSGSVLWTKRFDGLVGELFDLQDHISQQVVRIIAPRVRDRELRRSMRKRPDNMTAYELVLRALELFYRADHDAHVATGELLYQAMRHDPGYAPAYSHAAHWHLVRISHYRATEPEVDAKAALSLAAAAVERTPMMPRHYLSVAICSRICEGIMMGR
jgi:TolB-like protein